MASIDSKEFVKPEPFCSFCLRERPPTSEFYKHVIGSSQEMRNALQSMLGYDFNLANFAVCKPCWKVMQLIQDFRLRCFRANEIAQRVSRGWTAEDGWFTAKNLATIESVRMTVADQMQQIGKINVARRALLLDDSMEGASEDSEGYHGSTDGSDEGSLESEITIGEMKIEAEEEPSNLEGSSDEAGDSTEAVIKTITDCLLKEMRGEQEEPSDEATDAATNHVICDKPSTIYTCRKHCEMTFMSRPGRGHHEKICTASPQTCTICKKQLRSNHSLKLHYKQDHPGERTHACTVCGKRFRYATQRRAHEWRAHSGDAARVFPCSVCSKKFKQSCALKVHMQVHTGVKPFTCEFCCKGLSQKRSLEQHIAAIHKDEASTKGKK